MFKNNSIMKVYIMILFFRRKDYKVSIYQYIYLNHIFIFSLFILKYG